MKHFRFAITSRTAHITPLSSRLVEKERAYCTFAANRIIRRLNPRTLFCSWKACPPVHCGLSQTF